MKTLLTVIGLLILLAGVVAGMIVGIGFYLSPQDQLGPADAIVAISGGETSQRAAEAVKVYRAGYAHVIIFSGAAADPTGPSNAAAMRAQAIATGVPAAAILTEDSSTTTAENAADVAPILHRLGAHTIILVTSPYHQRRASLNFHQVLGPSVRVINHSSVDSVWRKHSWWTQASTIELTLSELQKTLYVWATKPSTSR